MDVLVAPRQSDTWMDGCINTLDIFTASVVHTYSVCEEPSAEWRDKEGRFLSRPCNEERTSSDPAGYSPESMVENCRAEIVGSSVLLSLHGARVPRSLWCSSATRWTGCSGTAEYFDGDFSSCN